MGIFDFLKRQKKHYNYGKIEKTLPASESKASEAAERRRLYEQSQVEKKEKEDARRKQCDSFTVDDMQNFPDIPIAWSYVMQLNHTNGVAWCQLNWNNRKIALNYISQVNEIILDAQKYIPEIGDAHIDLEEIDFEYPRNLQFGSMCNTRFECYPYTASGKLSKFPVILPFATKWRTEDHGDYTSEVRTSGEIKILKDGNIGAATVNIKGFCFKIGLHGISLVLKRVDNPYMGGNLFKFSDIYD